MPTNNSIQLLKVVVLFALIAVVPSIINSGSASKQNSSESRGSLIFGLFSTACDVWDFVGDASDLKGLIEMSKGELLSFLKTVLLAYIGFCLVKNQITNYMQKQTLGLCALKADVRLLPA